MTNKYKDWREEFDEKFDSLPFNKNEPPVYIMKGEMLDGKMFEEQIKGGVIQMHDVDAVRVMDNKNIRQEIKSFIEQIIEGEKEDAARIVDKYFGEFYAKHQDCRGVRHDCGDDEDIEKAHDKIIAALKSAQTNSLQK